MNKRRFGVINWSRVFGYDFFISFKLGAAPHGTQSYASDLARVLRERGFAVYFSEQELPPGGELKSSLVSALHRSRALVVVCDENLVRAPGWVKVEVEEYRRARPRDVPVVINIGRAIEGVGAAAESLSWLISQGQVWIDETAAACAAGLVSPHVAARLEVRPRLNRANTWLRLTMGTVAAALLCLTGVAAWKAIDAAAQRDFALAEKSGAQTTLARSDFTRALSLIDEDDSSRAVSYLARSMLLEPSRPATALRLSSLLLQRAKARVTARFLAARGAIQDIQFSPDGRMIAATTRSELIVWDGQLKNVIIKPPASPIRYTSATFSADSRWLAATTTYGGMGGTYGVVSVWDTNTPTAEPRVIKTKGMTWGAKFSRADQAVVVNTAFAIEAYSLEPEPRLLWKVELEDLAKQVPGLSMVDNAFSDFDFVDDDLLVVYGTLTPAAVGRWSRREARFVAVQELPLTPERIRLSKSQRTALLVFPNDQMEFFTLSGQRGGQAIFINPAKLTMVGEIMRSSDHFSSFSMLSHEQMAFSGSKDGTVGLWTTGGKPLSLRSRHREAVTSVDAARHGLLVASGSRDGVVRVWHSLEMRRHFDDLVHSSAVTAVRFAPDALRLAAGTASGELLLWDVSGSPAVSQFIDTGAPTSEIVMHPGGTRLVALGKNGQVEVWDVDAGVRIAAHEIKETVTLHTRAGGDRLLVAWDRFVGVVDMMSGAFSANWADAGGRINQLEYDSAGNRVLAAANSGRISVWDASSGARIAVLENPEPITSAIFLPKGEVAFAAGSRLAIWNISKGEVVRQAASTTDDRHPTWVDGKFTHRLAGIVDLRASRDGRRLVVVLGGEGVTVGTDRIRGRYFGDQFAIWTTHDLKQLALANAGRDDPTTSALSPSGRILAVGSRDGAVRLWSTEDGTPVGSELVHNGAIRSIFFDAEESRVFVTDAAPRLSIWRGFTRADRPLSLALRAATSQGLVRGGVIVLLQEGRLEVRDAASGEPVIDALGFPRGARRMAVSDSTERMAVLDASGRTAVAVLPFPKSDADKCQLAYAAEELAGFRLDAGDLPVPSSEPPLGSPALAGKCHGNPAATDELVTKWLKSDPNSRTIAPGLKTAPQELLRRMAKTGADEELFALASKFPSDLCARFVLSGVLKQAGTPVLMKIGEHLDRHDAGQAHSCLN